MDREERKKLIKEFKRKVEEAEPPVIYIKSERTGKEVKLDFGETFRKIKERKSANEE